MIYRLNGDYGDSPRFLMIVFELLRLIIFQVSQTELGGEYSVCGMINQNKIILKHLHHIFDKKI